MKPIRVANALNPELSWSTVSCESTSNILDALYTHLGPIVGRPRDLDGKRVIESKRAETDVDTKRSNHP